MVKTLSELDSQRINTLFYKKKKLLSSYYQKAKIKDNFVILQRRNGDCEFHEGVTAGEFEYTHSDKSERKILLRPVWQVRFKFLDDDSKGYLCHEDYPIPLNADMLPFMIDEFEGSINKVYRDDKAWDEKKFSATEKSIKALVPLAITLGVLYIVYILVKPEETVQIIQQATPVAKEVARNISQNASGVLG